MLVDPPLAGSSNTGPPNQHSQSSGVTPPPADYTNVALQTQQPEAPLAGQFKRKPKVSGDCYKVLTSVFGHSEYKGKQKEIVEAATHGADVLVIAPTGLGKSLCFQIPAIADEHGITIVISPLLALMKNQVTKLRELDIAAVAFTSETSADEKQRISQDLHSGHPTYRLLYVTPEKMCSKEFMELLKTVHSCQELNRLVVDEAHCISEWGHDFRTEYRRLGSFRDRFPDVPIMALTASATANVQDDIVTSLKMSPTHMYKAVHPFNRPNLYYEVRYLQNPAPAAQMADIYGYINTLHTRRGRPSSGIIYCRTRATCDALAAYLRGKGLNARPYHRGLKSMTLNKTLEDWQIGGCGNGGIDLVVATIAFGCGIDKSDVRYVIHYDLPKSLEGFYQETGRAGRDGSPSKCILYYSREDVLKVKKLVSMAYKTRQSKAFLNAAPAPTQRTVDSLSALIELAESTSLCRHVSICRYFGEPIDEGDEEIVGQYCYKMCDVCKYPDKTKSRHSKLASAEYISTQAARLERFVEPGEDDECLPVSPRLSTLHPRAKGGGILDQTIQQEISSEPPRPARPVMGNPRMSLGVKRAPLHLPETTGKRMKLHESSVIQGPPSSKRLTRSLKKQFKTPFNETRAPTRLPELQTCRTEIESPPNYAVVQNVAPDDEEAAMIESAFVACARSSSPVDLPDEKIMVDASYSQKIPTELREYSLKSIRVALQKVFIQYEGGEMMWQALQMGVSDSETRLRVLALTATELEFVAHSYCSTTEGYQALSLAQVSAVKLLKDHDLWEKKLIGTGADDEHEDAMASLSIIRRIASQVNSEVKVPS